MRLDPSFKAQFISNRSSHEHDAINHITWPIRTLDQENEDVDALSVRHAQTWRIDTNPKPFIHKYQNPFFSINPTKATFYHQLFWKHPLLIKLTKIWFSHLPAAAISVDMATKYIAYFPAVFFSYFSFLNLCPFQQTRHKTCLVRQQTPPPVRISRGKKTGRQSKSHRQKVSLAMI